MPQRFWRRVWLLSVSIVLFAVFITISLSHLETKYRLEIVEYQHRLFLEEASSIPDSVKKTQLAEDAISRLSNRRYSLLYKSSLGVVDKIITELENLKKRSNNNYIEQNERPDYALGTAGAKILSVGKTKVLTSLPKWLSMLGFDYISKYFVNGAHRVIQPSIYPGECFAFTGPGEIIIKLIRAVFIDAVSIDHILQQMSPDGSISTAPSMFNVYGMENEDNSNATHLGTFYYDIELKQSQQEFQLASNISDKSFPIVKFEFVPNHNDVNYTCIYRVRVHGSLIKSN